jgi:hypothetical protein
MSYMTGIVLDGNPTQNGFVPNMGLKSLFWRDPRAAIGSNDADEIL